VSEGPSRPTTRRARALAVVVTALLLAPSARGDAKAEAAAQRARLDAVLADVAARRADLKDLEREERSLVVTLGELDRALFELDRAFEEARARSAALDEVAVRLDAELATDEARLVEVEARLLRRLRALYVVGDAGAIRHLLGAETFEDLAYRRRLLTTLAEDDARLLEERARAVKSVREKKSALAAAREELDELTSRIEAERAASTQARADRAAFLKRVDSERELLARTLRELLVEERAVTSELARLTAKSAGPPRATSKGLLKKGGLLRPVDGPVVRAFGTVREAGTGASLTSNGVHIKAPMGTPVQSPADGRVVHTGWLRGYGRMVIVDHGDGVHTLFAHLSRENVEKGEQVTRGQTLGFVGDTESFDGAELYFELRRNGRPRDPVPSF